MGVTVTGKLNRAAHEHGNNFFVDIGKREFNYKTKEKEWVNYSAALYAKDNQLDFYRQNLVEGAVIEVSGTGLLIDTSFTGNDGIIRPKLLIQNPTLCNKWDSSAPQHNYQAPQQHTQQTAPPPNQTQGVHNAQQPVPQQNPGFDDFDDDIPF
jgi:hypothetical protein